MEAIGMIAFILVSYVLFLIVITLIEKNEDRWLAKLDKKLDIPPELCYACRKHRTMDCPNSSMCLATEEKPYFEPKG